MIMIIDFSQICISAITAQLGRNTNADEKLLRHICLLTLKTSLKKFKKEYPEVIIACDNKNYWRKEKFPYYKANRKDNIKKSELDWKIIFDVLHSMKKEIREYFPYRVMEIDQAEADDIIGVLTEKFSSENKKVMIVSGDKDFIQLLRYDNVKIYDPIRKRYLSHDNPKVYLQEHVLKGDAGDGIPNVMSDDKTFIEGRRQKPLTTKRMNDILNTSPEKRNDDIRKNILRNELLIDLSYIPARIQDEINNLYDQEMIVKDKSKLMTYMIRYQLNNLIEDIQDF